MHTPSREEFVAAARRGNLIPVYRELLADGDTPVSAYAALGAGEHSFVLESVIGGSNWAAYSFVGVAPRAVVRWQAGTARVTWYDVDAGGPPRTAEWQTPDPTAPLPEEAGELRWTAGIDLPPLCMVVTDTLLIFDNLRQTLKVVATPYVTRPERAEVAYDRACARIDAIIETLRSPRTRLPELTPPRLGEA